MSYLESKKRSALVLSGSTTRILTGCGKLYVTVNKDSEGNLFEVFITTGRKGGCPAQSEAIGRLVSLALQAGVLPKAISDQLLGIRCFTAIQNNSFELMSCPAAIGQVLSSCINRTDV